MIRFEKVSKCFGDRHAVRELDLEIPPGEVFAFLGPNGAGKTTTVKMCVGLLRPTSGRIEVCGHPAGGDDLKAKGMIAYVPDQPFVYNKLTGREFLHFVGRMFSMSPAAIAAQVDRFAGIFEIDYLDYLCETYSHGMKQRLVLTSALMHEPRVLILDEPLVGLDPMNASRLKAILVESARNAATVFMSTHSLGVAEETAHRIGIIKEGRLIALGSMEDLAAGRGDSARLEDVFLQITREEASSYDGSRPPTGGDSRLPIRDLRSSGMNVAGATSEIESRKSKNENPRAPR